MEGRNSSRCRPCAQLHPPLQDVLHQGDGTALLSAVLFPTRLAQIPHLHRPPSRPPQVVMQLVDSMVKRTNEQLTESTGLLQEILRAAADPQVRPPRGWAGGRAGGCAEHQGRRGLCPP